MPEITLNAEVDRPLGSSASRRLRRAGKIPGVVYGHGTDPIPVAVVGRDLRVALSGDAGLNALLSLRAGDRMYLALARELQRDPVRGTLTHVDFQIVRRDEVISADVPVVLVGDAVEVHHGDGIVDQQLFSLHVRAVPADIPSSVEIDISGLTIGAVIRVADVHLPAGVTTDLEADAPVATGVPPRVAAAVEGVAEGGEMTPAAGGPVAEAPEGSVAAGPGSQDGQGGARAGQEG